MNSIAEIIAEIPSEGDCYAERLKRRILAWAACMGKRTITGLICALGDQLKDWSGEYKMYNQDKIDPHAIFNAILSIMLSMNEGPLVAALDDTHIRKTGRKSWGVKYSRDPMSPPFRPNLMLAQRFLQISAAFTDGEGRARMIPVDWIHAPAARKPGKNASEEEAAAYRQISEKSRLGRVGAQRLARLRRLMDESGFQMRVLWAVADGSLTNGAMLKNLPHNTIFTGRIRKDAKLFHPPSAQPEKGRRRIYGERAPAPEELYKDPSTPWEEVDVFFGGKIRTMKAERVGPLLWRPAGEGVLMQMIVLQRTDYKITKNGWTLHREPAYLICTSPEADLREVLQHYIWRWDIEVNFRDEKTIMGVGEAQVRTPSSVQNVPAVVVASYATLLLAAEICRERGVSVEHLTREKWRREKPQRVSTMTLIQNLRCELWAEALHFYGFASGTASQTKPMKCHLSLKDAVLYASNYA